MEFLIRFATALRCFCRWRRFSQDFYFPIALMLVLSFTFESSIKRFRYIQMQEDVAKSIFVEAMKAVFLLDSTHFPYFFCAFFQLYPLDPDVTTPSLLSSFSYIACLATCGISQTAILVSHVKNFTAGAPGFFSDSATTEDEKTRPSVSSDILEPYISFLYAFSQQWVERDGQKVETKTLSVSAIHNSPRLEISILRTEK